MALESTIREQQEQSQHLTKDEEDDLKIAVNMAKNLIDDGGIEVVDQAVNTSKDPGQVIGQFLMQMVSQMSEKLPEEAKLSPRIYFAEGGWIEQISDYLQEEYGVSKEVMDRAEMYVGTTAQQMAQQQQGGGQQQAPAPQPQEVAPAMPQQGGMV